MTINTYGTHFTVDGELVHYAGFSEFRLLDRFLLKENLKPLFEDRQAVLMETMPAPFLRVLRVLAMADSFMQLWPQHHGDNFYTSVSALSDYANRFGFTIDWECFADAQIIMPNLNEQKKHWERMIHAVRGRRALLSIGNEWRKNGWNPDDFSRPDGIVCSRGSNLGDADPPLPPWDYSKYHGRRDGVKGLLSSTDLCWAVHGYSGEGVKWPGTHGPTIHDEPIGAAEQAKIGSRSATPKTFYNIGFNAAICGAGGTFHSSNGVQSEPFQPIQKACALAFFMAMSKADPVQSYDGSEVI